MAEMARPIRLILDQANLRHAGFMSRKTAHQIDAEAADWAARLDRGPFSPEEEQSFQLWLNGDVRAMGGFGRMRALALLTERARALGADFDPAAFVPGPPRYTPSRRTLLQAGSAIAATVLLGVAGTWEVLRHRGRFSTGKGETKWWR